jgi:hypothetical protein
MKEMPIKFPSPGLGRLIANIRREGYDIYVGRLQAGHNFGNPFGFSDDSLATVKLSSREAAIEAYEGWLRGKAFQWIEPEKRKWILERLPTLKGKVLGCFCYPKQCHAEVLVKMANGEDNSSHE